MYCSDPDFFLNTLVETNRRAGVSEDLLDLIASYSALRLARNREVDFYGGARPIAEKDTVILGFLKKNNHLDERTKNFLTAYFQEMRESKLTCVLSGAHLAHLLGTSLDELQTFAKDSRKNYHSFSITKSSGKKREILAPNDDLKTIQRKILQTVLNQVPLNDHAEGFRPQRSIVTNAGHHLNKSIVIKADLQEFFPSISSQRVFGMFLSLGYPRQVATLLRDLTCHKQLLPTGAPTSPAIANIICRKLDKRFANLGKKVGFAYSRYADDLTFSSVDPQLMRMIPFFKEIIAEEGFQLNESKLRILRNGRRQTVTGVVVNEKPNISKSERKILRAILNNCNQGDIYSQKNKWASNIKRLSPGIPYSLDDFRRSLLAKIHFVKMVNPPAGQKLLSSYYSISWPA